MTKLIIFIISLILHLHSTDSLVQVFYTNKRDTPLYSFEEQTISVHPDYYNHPILVGHLIYFDEPPNGCNTPPKAPPTQDNLKWFLLSRFDKNVNPDWWDKCNTGVRVKLATDAGYSAVLLEDVTSNSTETVRGFNGDIYSAFINDGDGILLRQKFTPSPSTYVVTIEYKPWNIFDWIFKVLTYAFYGIVGFIAGVFLVSGLCCFICYVKKKIENGECCCCRNRHRSRDPAQNERSRLMESNMQAQRHTQAGEVNHELELERRRLELMNRLLAQTLRRLRRNEEEQEETVERLSEDQRTFEGLLAQLFGSFREENEEEEHANQRFLQQYPTTLWTGSEPRTFCTICMSELVKNDTVRRLPCLHVYHQECIDRWLQEKNICPNCNHIPV